MLQAAAASQHSIAAKVKANEGGEAGQGYWHSAQAPMAQAEVEVAQPRERRQMLQAAAASQLLIVIEVKALEGSEA